MPYRPDENEVRRAFEQLEPTLQQVPEHQLMRPRIRIRESAERMIAIAQIAKKPPWVVAFESLSKSGLWSIESLDNLYLSAQALWYARHRMDQIIEKSSAARVAADLAERAVALRDRMRKVCEFCLEGDVNEQDTLAYLRKGRGFEDLADDLHGYAMLYRKHFSLISQEPLHYDEGDVDLAEELNEELLAQLGIRQNRETEPWVDYQIRAFSLVAKYYAEVRAAALFVGRSDNGTERLFPSLYQLARRLKTSRAGATNDGRRASWAPVAGD